MRDIREQSTGVLGESSLVNLLGLGLLLLDGLGLIVLLVLDDGGGLGDGGGSRCCLGGDVFDKCGGSLRGGDGVGELRSVDGDDGLLNLGCVGHFGCVRG